jgi:hypothetical protein
MDYVTYGQNELRHVMSEIKDLDAARDALIRETTIRDLMAASGEDRQTVMDAMDAMDVMHHKAVTDLIKGEPTTLQDALQQYVDRIHAEGVPDGVEYDLSALLAYPWPGVPDAEAHWRSRLAQEVYQHADRIEREPETRSLGVALASVVRHVGDQIGKMP